MIFLLADFLGLHARETTVSATFFVNFSRAVPGLRHFSALGFWGLRYFGACMRAKPQFWQHFIVTLLDIRAHVSARSVSDSFFFFCLVIFPSRVLSVFDFVACMRAKHQFRQHFIFTLFHIRAHGSARSVSDIFFSLCLSCHFVAAASCGFWIFVVCMRPQPQFWHQLPCSKSLRSPENPCPKHNNVRVPRAYGDR